MFLWIFLHSIWCRYDVSQCDVLQERRKASTHWTGADSEICSSLYHMYGSMQLNGFYHFPTQIAGHTLLSPAASVGRWGEIRIHHANTQADLGSCCAHSFDDIIFINSSQKTSELDSSWMIKKVTSEMFLALAESTFQCPWAQQPQAFCRRGLGYIPSSRVFLTHIKYVNDAGETWLTSSVAMSERRSFLVG